jgi:hypothetical protein
MKNRLATQWLAAAVVCMVLGGWAATARAADDPSGTWKWSTTFNNQTRERSLTLKYEDGKLTGTVPGRNNTTTPIENGSFKDGVVKFEITRTRGDNKFTSKYEAKLDGDTLKGKITFTRDGKETSRDWEAKRS